MDTSASLLQRVRDKIEVIVTWHRGWINRPLQPLNEMLILASYHDSPSRSGRRLRSVKVFRVCKNAWDQKSTLRAPIQ
jgi:hypothetical protein